MGSPWKHRLLSIDEDKRTAVCSTCGPVRVYKKKSASGYTIWRCSKAYNKKLNKDQFDEIERIK